MLSVAVNLIVFFFGIVGFGRLSGLPYGKKAPDGLSFTLCLGMISVYLTWLITWNVGFCYYLLFPLSVWGIWHVFRSKEKYWFLGSLITLIALFMFDPIQGWDARSIWFFQAKILHSLHGTELFNYFLRPEIQFTHVDNPKLMPALAALANYNLPWSEYFPRAVLVLLWLPIPLVVKTLKIRNYEKIFLSIALATLGGAMVLSDYMDWIFAVYGTIGAWLLFNEDESQTATGLLFLSICCNLKVEGVALSGIILLWYFLPRLKSKIRATIFFIPAAVATLLWRLECSYYGISSYFNCDKTSVVSRLSNRLHDFHTFYFIQQSFFQTDRAWLEVLFISFMIYAIKRSKIDFTLLKIALCYWIFLTFIYLSTPYTVAWHLRTSINRTVLPVYLLITLCVLLNPMRVIPSSANSLTK